MIAVGLQVCLCACVHVIIHINTSLRSSHVLVCFYEQKIQPCLNIYDFRLLRHYSATAIGNHISNRLCSLCQTERISIWLSLVCLDVVYSIWFVSLLLSAFRRLTMVVVVWVRVYDATMTRFVTDHLTNLLRAIVQCFQTMNIKNMHIICSIYTLV